MAQDKVTNLYNAFVKNGYAMESEAQFRENLKDPKKRKAAYDALVADGYNMEPFADFESNIGFGAPAPAPAPKSAPQQQSNQATTAPTPTPATAPTDGAQGEAETAPVQSAPKQPAWQPTEQEKIRIQEDLRRVSSDVNRRMEAQSKQIKGMITPLTKEGRRKLANAENMARMAGQKTQVSPGSGIGVLDRSPKPYDVKYDKNGKPVVEWLLADGNTTADMNVARAYDEEAKRQWRQDEFVKRMEANGLDVSNPDHVKTQAAIDAVHSGNYISADERLEILNEITGMGLNPRNQEHIKWVLTGNERKIIQYRLGQAEENLKELYRERERERQRKAEEMKKKNEDKSFLEELWDRFAHPSDYGEQPYSPSYIGQVKPHPSVTGATQSQEDIELENATAEVVALQNALREYDQKVAASGKNWLGKIAQGAWDGITDPNTLTAGFLDLSVNHTARKHKSAQLINSIKHAENLKAQAPDPGGFYSGGRFAGEMIADPITYVSGGAGKVVSSGVKRAITGGAAKKLGGNVAERLAMNSLGGRMISGAAGSGANLFAFEGLRDMRQQIIDGGWTDEDGKFHEGFSWGHALSQGGHGLMLGTTMGVFGAGVGNAGDWMVGKVARSTASNGVKAAGETAIRGAQHATAFVGEGTIFALPDIYEFQTMDAERFDELYADKYGYADKKGEDRIKARDAARNSLSIDAWSESQAMVFGMKVSGGMMHPKKIISDVSERLNTLKEQGERDHTTFPERVRKMMERSHFDVALTKEEKAEMRQAGYGRLSEIFTKDKADPNTKNRPLDDSGKIILEDAGFDYYSEMGRFMNDRNISQAARAKVYFMLTGHTLPMGTVSGYTTIKGEDGSVWVNSVTADGEVVTSRAFADEAKAQGEINNINRQAELNSVDMGEHYKADEVRRTAIQQACEEIAEQNPDWTVEGLRKAYEQAKKDMLDPVAAKEIGEGTLKMVQAVNEAAGKKLEELEGETPDAIRERINKAREVDIDEALRKERGKRTEAEQEAIDEYLKELYPEDMGKEDASEPTPEQAEAQSQYEQGRELFGRFEEGDPTVQADVDAIALRMQEAYQALEDAFGSEAEYYMFHVNENPWALVDDPELTVEQKDAVLYYINAKAALDGVMDASNEVADRKRAEVEESVAKRTHNDNGMIIPATMKVDDRPVYIVKGDVVMFPDGSGVDATNSSESIVIMDESGEYKFVSPDQIYKVGESIDPQDELQTAYNQIDAEQQSIFGVDVPPKPEAPSQPIVDTSEYDRGYEQGLEEAAKEDDAWIDNLIKIYSQNTPESMSEDKKGRLDAYRYEQQRRAMEAQNAPAEITGNNGTENIPQNGNIGAENIPAPEQQAETALSRIPLNEKGEPSFEAVDKETAWDGLVEAVGGEDDAVEIALAQVQQATADLEALNKKPPTMKAPKLKGSPMAMAEAKRKAAKQYQNDFAQYNQQIAEAQARIDAWNGIVAVHNTRNAELRRQQEEARRQRDAEAHDAAVARFEKEQRIKAEKQAEQERIGVHAVNPKIKEKWEGATKIQGNEDIRILADGTVLKGRYWLVPAEATTPSHNPFNGFEPTEGFPIDVNGQSTNDRDYWRDKDAQGITESMGRNYDARGWNEPPTVDGGTGVVWDGSGRTMAGQLAAKWGTDQAHNESLAIYGRNRYGFTEEQVRDMPSPRVIFVPYEALPFDAATFARFNAQEKKSQGKPEAAVKLGKIVPDNVFNSIVNDISRYDRLSDYYADEKAVAQALGALMQAGVINDKQMPELRTGTAISAGGRELIENTLIGKVFQASPDAVRQIISMPTLRQSIVMGLNEIANNRTLARNVYDISEELAKAVDLVTRAKAAMPDVYTDGMPVSPFGRMQGLFDDEFGDSRVTDGTALLLADILNSGKPSDLRKVLSSYNNEAAQASGGQMDMFSGSIPTKEEILTTVNEHFRNATPKEQQALVDAAIAERKRRAEADAEQRERSEASEQTPHDDERRAEPQQPTAGDTEFTELEPLSKDRNDLYEDTPEEAALRARISVGDEWEEEGPAPDKPIYKRKLYVDGKHEVIQTDAPDKNGSYTGSQLTFEGRDFGDLKEIADYIDNLSKVSASSQGSVADYIDGGMQAQQAEPTEAQKAAGNYKMEHRRVDGYNISIENAKGSVRRGTSKDKDGNETPWETVMQNDYGYIRGTEGVDGDHIDVFLSDTPEEGDVFVVDQVNADGSFDEHKVMYGFPTEQAARDAYLSNYEPGWTGLGAITHVSKDEFKKWIQSSRRKTKPFAEYKSVKVYKEQNPNLVIEPDGFGDFGPVFTQFKGDAQGAIKVLSELQDGEAIGALHHKDIGDIDLVWGNAGTGKSDGFGLAKLVKFHPEVVEHLQEILDDMHIVKRSENRINLESDTHKAAVRLTWNKEKKKWLLTAFEKRETSESIGKTTDTDDNPSDLRGDTALSQNSDVSDGKVNTLSADKQADGAESSKPYTITPTTYTNKRNKTTNVFLVKFNRELTAEEKAALDTFAREPLAEGKKTSRGWYDHKQGGYMMRSEEAARQLAEMIGNEEAVADAQPMTAEELREAVAPAAPAEKKPARKPKKAPINRVSLEDVMTDLSEKGETKFSDHAEPVKTEPEAQYEISDDEMQSLANELRDLLGIGDDEGDTNIKFRDPGELTPQERQRIQSAGIRMGMGLIERGTTAFPDYATKMVGLLGDKIRPWLKSFYEGARWTPGYDKYTFTPTEQVATFDVQNFDKKQADPIAQAAMIVEERKASTASAQAQKELTETRNKNRRENDKQTEADTAALAEKAEAVAGEAEVTAQSAGTGEAGRKRILRDLKRVDETIEEVNDQLALLGYYEADLDAPEHEVYGLRRSAEKKAVKDAVKLAQHLVDDLGLGLDKVTGSTTDKRGKKPTAVSANVAPVGGDIVINLPYTDGRNLYINIGLAPTHERGVEPNRGGGAWEGDNYEVDRIMFRFGDGHNHFLPTDVTYGKMLTEIQNASRWGQPKKEAPKTAEVDHEAIYQRIIDILVSDQIFKDAIVRGEVDRADKAGNNLIVSAIGRMSLDENSTDADKAFANGFQKRTGESKKAIITRLINRAIQSVKDSTSAEEPQEEAYHGTVTLKDGREAVVISANHVQNIGEPSRLTDYIVGVKGEPGTIKISPDEIAHAGAPTAEDKPSTPAKADETHNGYKIGDEVMWDRYGNGNWEKQTIVDFEKDGSPIFDSMGMGMMMEIGDWSRIKPADGIFGEAQRVVRKTAEDKQARAERANAVADEIMQDKMVSEIFDIYMKKFGSRKEELADTWSEGKSEAINIRLPYVRRQITQRLVADKIFSTEKEADRFFHDEILPRLEKQWMSKAATDNAVSVLKGGKKPAKKRTEVKPEQPVADLFGGLFDEPISNEKKTDVQPRPGTAERERGHEPQSHEPLGESQRNEVKGTNGRGMGGRSSVNPMSDGERGAGVPRKPKSQPVIEPVPESERKNVRNNHAERGVDYAPKGEDARIKANMEAIELAKRLLDAGETATPEQMAVLRKFSGWGGLGKAFNEQGYTPNPIAKRLKELLGEDGYQDAVDSRRSAYYTPAEVIDTMWDVARAMGFKGGNVLEGSAGIGNIIGLMPTDMSERSSIHAVEIDRTTGGILSLLYPDAKVEIQGFEKTRVQNGTVDLAITNVPFITGAKVFDETGDKDLSKKFHDIHDFCIAKNIRKLREGGIGIFITSSGTMDNSKELRLWIIGEGNADVVGAFRMHNKTFGGTGATSDIIVVRKRVNGKPSPNAIDVTDAIGVRVADYDTGDTRKVKGQEIPIIKQYSMMYNKYFAEHPENMAGEMMFNFERGETRFPTSRALFPVKEKEQSKMLAEWAGSFADMEEEATAAPKVEDEITRINEQLGEGVKEGSMVLNSLGELCMARMGEAVPLGLNKNKVKGHTKAECFKAYSAIKKALSDVLEYQSSNEGDEGLAPLLKELNRAFDTFTRTYGNLHKNTAISFLRNDVDFSSILALETYSEKGDKKGNKVVKVGKTDIFSRRVIDTEKEPQPTTIKDAILASLYKSGGVDVEYIGQALGKPTEEVKREIVSSGLGFENPSTGTMEVSYKYLSGNVREKLHIAQENNADGRYDANIKALEGVMPMTIPAHLIEFSLGSSWIEPKLYEDFVFEKTGLRVTLTNAGGTWFMKTPWSTFNEKNRAMAVVSKMCDKTIMGHELIEAAITNRQITVSKTEKHYDGSTETITDKAATAECGTKVDEIRAEFKDWAREHMQADPAMSARIEQTYNDQFNNYVPMSIPDEFVPQHFGGQVSELHGCPFALRPHQGRAVVRGTTEPILLAHEVGTGKTYTLITTAMEMRRLGTARKPMIVVQNATVGQFVESAKEIYPNAKVLTIEEADRTAEGRKNFYAKIKYNDWDMIVVPQSVFERIPDSEEREMAYVKDIIEEKMKVLEAMREADSDGRSMIVRQAERELAEQEARLAELTETMQGKKKKRDEKREATTRQNAEVRALEMLDREVDDVENFDDMGIDAILVDEAHEYKHLGFATAMQRGVKGVDPSYSKKSQGVFLKAQAVMERNNGRNVVFATGTPISNTAAEIWTFMRYLMPVDTMKSYGIYYFDDFVRNFGNIAQMVEFSTNGKFKENNRFAGYVNLPELVRIWSSVADTVLTREAGGVSDKIPDMEGGKPQDIYLPQTRALRSVMKYVKAELDRYDKMTGKEKKENSHIPLTMYGIAKAAAVDVRLVVPNAEDDPNSKTNATVRETLRSLRDSEKYKGTVAIFSDNYQNKQSGFNLYEDIRKKLIAEGVPAEQIVVIKPGMTVKRKLDIFEKVNAGEIRVIMGSTFTLGTGVNIQERLHTLIHVDAPNRPMDYTQRNGRALRQGNLHKDMGIPVRIIRFGVEDSLDVTAYQRLKTKGAIADSIMNGSKMMQNSMENRVLEEEEDSFGDMTAQLSGSEYAILKNQAEREVRNLTAKQKGHDLDQIYVHNQLPKVEGFIKGAERRIEIETKNLEIIGSHFPDGTIKKITIGKLTFDSVTAMEDFFKEQNAKMNEAAENVREGADNYTSKLVVDVDGLKFEVTTTVSRTVDSKGQGTLTFEPERNVTYSCEELGIKDQAIKGNRLKNIMQKIAEDIVTGRESRELLSRGQQQLAHYTEERTQLEQRNGREFPHKQELAEAKERLAKYEEAMKKELAEKEAKYAELDKSVETASDITLTDEDSTDTPTTGDGNKYRDGETMSEGERLRAIRALEPVAVERNEMSRAELREVYNNLPSVEKDGREIEFYRSAFKKIYKEGGLFGQVVPVLDEVLEKSVLAYSEEDNLGGMARPDGSVHKEHPNIIAFDNFIGKIVIDGNEYYVRTTVERGYDGRNGTHSFFVTGVDIYEKTADSDSSPGYPRATEANGIQIANGLSIPNFPSGESDHRRIVDAKLQQFFERASSEANILDMRDRVNELSERSGVNVRVITDESELTEMSEDGKPRYGRRERRAKGWWSAKDDEVVIVLPNNVNVADVDNTFVHEVAGHKGLRALVGEERFDEFLGEIYDHASNPIRKVIDKMTDRMVSEEADRLRTRKAQAHERAGEDVNANYYTDMAEARVEAEKKREDFRKEATEEYMSDLGGRIGSEGFEKMSRDELTLWGKIKAKVQAFLDKFLQGLKIAKSIRLNDKDLSYILYKSWKNLRKKGVFADAEDAVMRRRTGYDDGMIVSDKRVRIEKLRKSTPVEISGEEFEYSSDIKQYKKNALEYGKTLQGEYENADKGVAIQLQRGRRNGGLKEVLQHDLSDEAHIKSIAAIPGIIEKSIYIDTRPNMDRVKNPDVKCYEHYVCGLRIGGEDYTVHSIVAADKNGNRYYDHKLSHIEKGRLLDFLEAKQPLEGILTPMSGTEPTIRSERKIKELISLLQVEDNGVITRFRDPGLGLEETITKMKAEAMQANAGNLQAKRDAMRAIGGNLNHLRQAMARQREYDITTAKSIKDLARILMENGLLDTLGNAEVKSLLAQVTNSIGRRDISKQVDRVFEIMVNNHLRNTELAFGKLISMRTSRVDGRGIQVQGDLDPDGQAILKVFNNWKGLTVDELNRRISDAIDAMSDTYAPIAERATLEYAGLQLAREYAENVAGSKNSEKMLREEVKKAKEEKDAGRMTSDAYKQLEDATRATITHMKLDRISALETLTEKLGGELAESVERAKAWREAEKNRVNRIHHLANSDMQGRELRGDHEDTRLMKLRNHWSFSWLLEPMSSLDQMLKMFGRQNPNGEGYLHNHFMRGWADAADSEQIMKESVHKQMDDKAAEIFGQHRVWYNGGAKKVDYTYSDIYGYAKALPGATITYYDGADMREYEIGQGELLYLYAVDKMPMGRATNRRMGIDEATMQNITNALNPKLKEYADWVQEELLPQLGDRANEVHKKMFGANMDAIENYFPFVRDMDALKREVENGQSNQTNDRISVQTGAIKKRVASVSKWNMRKCNFMDVLAKHVDEMCHWTAFAELNRDFGTLLSYNRLKQQVFAMNSVYGAGEQLWKRFEECCAIATDAYDPQRAKFDRFMVQGAKGVTMGKISLRTFTALKQTLSLPAFLGEVNIKHIAADLATGGVIACQWAWKNMPNFRKRILSRTSGDYRLKENEYDGKIMKASSYGMLPNIGVDAWTIAVMSHGVYKTLKAKYLRWGMSETDADHRAIQDAELCYNKSQQSSEGPFMAPVQVDHTFYATTAMLFRNSSTSYTREAHASARNLKRLISGEVNEDFVAKQILRTLYPEAEEAWTEEQWAKARKNAKREIRSAYVKNTVNLAMFGWILPWLWRIGGVAPLLLLSGDDDEKNKQWEDATRQSIFAPIEGLAYGDVIEDGLNMLTGANEKSIYNLGRSNPLISDILQAIKKADKDQMAAANDVINILGGMATGINPQTITDWATAIIDYNSDVQTQHECALLVARLLSCPPSQLEKVYFEELDMDALEASKLTPNQLASRYAEYKMMREAPLTGWMRSTEASDSIKSAKAKRVLDNAKDRIDSQSNERSNVNASWLSDYDTVKSRLSKIRKVKEEDEDRYYELLEELEASPAYERYWIVRGYRHDIQELSKSILRAKNAEEMQQLTDSLVTLKRDMVRELSDTQQ